MPDDLKKELPSQEASYALIKSQSGRAMHYLMFHEEDKYTQEIDALAETCANLLNKYDEHIDFVVKRMEASMAASYLHNLKELDKNIKNYQTKRAGLSSSTFYGEKEIETLSRQIKILEKAKNESPRNLMQGIVTDTLAQAHKKFDAAIEDYLPIVPPR